MRVSVSICIPTYKRPERLTKLLLSLNELAFLKTDLAALNMEVVVVDNDPSASARLICDDAKHWLRWPLIYHVEPRRGIPYARNAAARLSSAADYIAFIDDDELPSTYWLDELLDAQRKYNSDAVFGPVLPLYEADTPLWVIRGRFFQRPRHATGTAVRYGATGNVLVKTTVFERIGFFDEYLAPCGGEDTDLFMRLRSNGGKLIWADAAVVYEEVPRSRSSLWWILKRAYRTGTIISLCERKLNDPRILIVRAAKGCAWFVIGAVLLLPNLCLGFHRFAWSLVYIFRGVGQLCGLAGFRCNEYK